MNLLETLESELLVRLQKEDLEDKDFVALGTLAVRVHQELSKSNTSKETKTVSYQEFPKLPGIVY